MAVIEITNENFQNEVLKAEKPVLLDFWAEWCTPCRMVSPIVDELSDELADTIKVGKINVDNEPELASSFKVMSIPTLIVMRDGEVSETSVGARPKEDLRKILNI